MLIIGITGTIGAGKGTIVDYLVNKKGFVHYSVRALLTEEINRRGLELNRDSMVAVANEIRAANTPSYIIESLYDEALAAGHDCIIESLRSPGEVEALREKEHFYLLAIDAKPEIRFERITRRKNETDHISYETFLDNETREMESDDPNKQNILKCISMADRTINNDGNIDDLHQQLESIINDIE